MIEKGGNGNHMKKIIVLVLFVLCVGTYGCSSSDVTDQVSNMMQAEDEHILGVKNANPSSFPDQTYGEAFDRFFGNPTWKYFVGTKEAPDNNGDGEPDDSEDNVDIVEFTGYCMYQDVEVKALLQFTLDREGDTFSPTFLSFNDVPQDFLTIASLLNAAFESGEGENAEQMTEDVIKDEEESKTDEMTEAEEESVETSEGDEYIIPDSDSRRLTASDTDYLTLQEINYAKNEIYARHGRKFMSNELNAYFSSKSWYHGTVAPENFDESVFSQVEKDNIKLLTNAEFERDPNGYQLDQQTVSDSGLSMNEELSGYYVGERGSDMELILHNEMQGNSKSVGEWSYEGDSGLIFVTSDSHDYYLSGSDYNFFIDVRRENGTIFLDVWNEIGKFQWDTMEMVEQYTN